MFYYTNMDDDSINISPDNGPIMQNMFDYNM